MNHGETWTKFAYVCKLCSRERPPDSFSARQRKKNKSEMSCQDCSQGPDWNDDEMKRADTSPPGWHSQSPYWNQFYDRYGRLLEAWRSEGIPRKMNLKWIRFTQSSCSEVFRDGRRISELVHQLRRAGDDSPLRNKAEIRVCLYKGRYWTVDHRRLVALREAFGGSGIGGNGKGGQTIDYLVSVRYFPEVGFLDEEFTEFIRKFTTKQEGLSIEVRRGGNGREGKWKDGGGSGKGARWGGGWKGGS